MKTVGFIDYYLDEYHANNYPEWLKEASNGELAVKYAYAEIPSPRTGLSTEEWCLKHGIEKVDTIEELIEKSDCLNVLSPDNPEMHEKLCDLALKSGKRVYVDKTFAETKESALKIFSIAEEHNTPCFSASALRYASELKEIDRSEVEGLVSVGPGPLGSYSIHQIEPIVYLMGPDVKRVKATGTEAHPAFVIEYNDGRLAHFSHHGWDCPFAMTADLKGEKTKRIEIASDYFKLFVKDMADFFLGAEPTVSHKDTVAVISVREAAIKAAEHSGEWIDL